MQAETRNTLLNAPLYLYSSLDAETLNAYIKRLAHILLAMKPPAKCHFEVNAAGGLSYRYTPAWEEFKLWGQGNAVPTAEKARECAELFIQKFDERYKNAKKQSLLPEDFPETLFFPFREFSKAAALYISADDKENKHHWTVSYQLLLQRYAGNVPMQYMEKAAWEGTELNLHIAKGGMLIGFDLGFPLIKNTSKQEPLHPYPIPDTEPIPSVLFRTLTNGKVAPFYMSEKGYLPAVKGAVGEEATKNKWSPAGHLYAPDGSYLGKFGNSNHVWVMNPVIWNMLGSYSKVPETFKTFIEEPDGPDWWIQLRTSDNGLNWNSPPLLPPPNLLRPMTHDEFLDRVHWSYGEQGGNLVSTEWVAWAKVQNASILGEIGMYNDLKATGMEGKATFFSLNTGSYGTFKKNVKDPQNYKLEN